MASLALGAIILSVVGTGLLFLYEIYFRETTQNTEISEEELQLLIEQLQQEQESQWDGDDLSEEEISTSEADLWEEILQESDTEVRENIQE